MSYDLAVWNTHEPMTRKQAIEVFCKICDYALRGKRWRKMHKCSRVRF